MESFNQDIEWDTGNTENGRPRRDADDRESILSNISDDEDVPASDVEALNAFLARAVRNMKEVVKRGQSAVKGIKATYAVKVAQQQS